MAFDVYVGTMTRFYRHDWENIVQQSARVQGTKYKMIYAGGEPAPPPPAEEVRQIVGEWCQAMTASLAPHGFGPVVWDESDNRPYFTDRPAWQGYTALLLWAAHAEHPNLPMPDELPESWVHDDAFARSSAPEFRTSFRSILEPQIWSPVEFPFVFDFPSLVSDKPCSVGSVFTLKEQLDLLVEQTSSQLGISAAYPSSTKSTPSLLEAAAFSIPLFRNLAAKACENRLPILLHY
jgi:hypothetical protein